MRHLTDAPLTISSSAQANGSWTNALADQHDELVRSDGTVHCANGFQSLSKYLFQWIQFCLLPLEPICCDASSPRWSAALRRGRSPRARSRASGCGRVKTFGVVATSANRVDGRVSVSTTSQFKPPGPLSHPRRSYLFLCPSTNSSTACVALRQSSSTGDEV